MGRLQNKVAVITGAGSGIGRASALRFAEEGASVVVTDLYAESAEKVAAEINAKGQTAIGLAVDVGVEAAIKDMIEQTVNYFGRIDVLYNNAVNNNPELSRRDRDLLNFDAEIFEWTMRVNTLGGVLACKYALPHMLKQGGGAILFTSSTSASAGEVTAFSYGASKAAVNWYVKTIAATYGKQGIRCNGIIPGVIRTPSQRAWSNPEMDAAFLDIHNSPRLGEPEDIANTALFLASDEAAFVNGSLYQVDGGISCATPMVPVVRKLLV